MEVRRTGSISCLQRLTYERPRRRRGEVWHGGGNRWDDGQGHWKKEGKGLEESNVGDRRLLGLDEW